MAFQIHWANPEKTEAPDTIDNIPHTGIDPDFVISRSRDGDVLSRFKDDVWDYRPYGAISPFYLASWWSDISEGPMDELARQITDEIKTLHWMTAFETTTNASRSRGLGALVNLPQILKAIAKIAYVLKTPLTKAHQNSKFQVALRTSISTSDKGFGHVYTLYGLFKDTAYWQHVDSIQCEIPRLVPEDKLGDILILVYKIRKTQLSKREQTPLIPTRIMGMLIENALQQIRAAEPYLDKVEVFIKAVYADPTLLADTRLDYHERLTTVRRMYPDSAHPPVSKLERALSPKVVTLEKFGLSECAKIFGLPSLTNFKNCITKLQTMCALVIHAFTGMRSSEVQVMPFEPIIHQAAKGFGELPVLVSHLKKFSQTGNFGRALVWATSEEGIFAVKAAQKLARINWFRHKPANEELPDNTPLFIGSSIPANNHQNHYRVPFTRIIHKTHYIKACVESLGLVIEGNDLEELRLFDAFRDWDSDPRFAIGAYWPLTSHQFRRSVAVYASRSGMVSLPTLKTQYKHLSEVMTALYAENSTYAESFLVDEQGKPIDNNSVFQSFRDSQAFNTSVRFHEQVIKSETPLLGPIGGDIQRGKDRGTLPKMLSDRAETEKAVKQGRYAYKETTVGGCTLKGSCPHFAVDLVLPCTSGCKDAILKPEKLRIYVESLQFDQQMMSPNSRPHKLISQEIEFVKKKYLEAGEKNA
ncbi:MAG: hypothetical protein COB09_10605 [Thalassobium sp.]|nr:MAG: hypothetical protein COB09_10605 [Thalassobium sp.]